MRRTAIFAGALAFGLAVYTVTPAGTSRAATVEGAPSEYQLKAVFLFNFAQFVEWPPEAFASRDSPFAICVVGADPFGADLDEAVRNESVRGRTLIVRRYASAAEHTAAQARETPTGACHILFVPRTEFGQLDAVRASLTGRHTLLVSDTPQRGVAIGFVKERNRLRLRIDPAAAKDAGLTISSKLLRVADVVGGAPR